MTGGKAIQFDLTLPNNYKEMASLECPICKAAYRIVHRIQFADARTAEIQRIFIKGYLAGEHVDPKHQHLDTYEPLDEY